MTVADQRILRGVAATLSWQNLDQDGAAAAPSGTVTVGVTRADGSTVVAAGTATGGAGSDPRTYTLAAADNDQLDVLTVTWADDGDGSTHTTLVEVVGGYYATIAEIRATANMSDPAKFPNSRLVAARRWFEDLCESYTGVTFVPRYRRDWFSPSRSGVDVGFGPLRAVRSVRVYSDADTYTSYTADELADIDLTDAWVLSHRTYSWMAGTRNLLIELEYGYDRPPEDVKQAALEAIRQRVLDTHQGPIVLSAADGAGGTTRYAFAGEGRPTGIPSVDTVLNRYRMPVFA